MEYLWWSQEPQCVHGVTLTVVKYLDKNLAQYIIPYATAVGDEFILMDDNPIAPSQGRYKCLENQGFLTEWNG